MRVAPLLLLLFGFSIAGQAKIDKLRLVWTTDPSTSITIGWNQVSGNDVKLEYHAQSGPRVVRDATPDRVVFHKGMRNTFVRLCALEPDAAYTFRITDSDGTTQDYWFKTAPDEPAAKMSFLAGGDSRTFREPRQRANRMVSKLRPLGVIFAGDMINKGTDEEWQNWFDDWQHTIAEDGRIFPIIPARGNHEKRNADMHKLFDTCNRKVYYAITFGGNLMRLYTLNTEMAMGGGQSRWLKKDMEEHASVQWPIVQYHKPVRPHIARKPEGNTQYKKWVPVFEEWNVRLAIESDSHTHKITEAIVKSEADGNDEGFVRDDENGIVYIGEGCWGAPLQTNDDDKSWTKDSGRVNQMKWIWVTPTHLEVRTVEYDNVDEVPTVADENVFEIKPELKLRDMKGTTVVKIKPKT